MTSAHNWAQIPYELRARPNWLIASKDYKGHNKVPTTLDRNGQLCNGSSTDRSSWLDFDTARDHAIRHGLSIGYVLSSEDSYVCIDLDVKNSDNEPNPERWSTQEQLDRFWKITQHFDSYTETSQSGKGLHIWVRGKTENGARHDNIEVYSSERFIVCTGNILFDKPIANRQTLVDILVGEIRAFQGASKKAKDLDEQDEVYSDEEILSRSVNADNSIKFKQLWEGVWKEDYPSQSEADLALLSMFTFYSRSNEQCRRLFRMSALGKREKAQKDDRYIDNTLCLIRGRQEGEDARDAKMAAHGAQLAQSLEAQARAYAASLGHPLTTPAYTPENFQAPPAQVGTEGSLDWPPGYVGALAGFIYRNAPRPVKEVAIVAALGLIAGICGKTWNIPGSGLNVYIVLVARSAVGKEAMHSGLGAILAKIREAMPTGHDFVDFTDFASGQALVKTCAANPCFVNVAGEWGRKLRRLAQDSDRDAAMQTLRTAMTNLYQKSGPQSVVGGLSYSTKENNIASVSGVSYSMIGETTPRTFYDSLTEEMMEDGFLSRFTIVEYTGDRPPPNLNPEIHPCPRMIERCISLMMHSKQLLSNCSVPIGVTRHDDAGDLMEAFGYECDREINKTNEEAWRQMWNRAQLKMMRIAALLAVADNSAAPCITMQHAQWALDLIRRDINVMRRKVENGEVGEGDSARDRKVISVIKEYFASPVGIGYKIPTGMKESGIIPRSYIHVRVSRLSMFTNARMGATKALDETLRNICDNGYLQEIDRKKLVEDYATSTKAFRLMNMPDYGSAVR